MVVGLQVGLASGLGFGLRMGGYWGTVLVREVRKASERIFPVDALLRMESALLNLMRIVSRLLKH